MVSVIIVYSGAKRSCERLLGWFLYSFSFVLEFGGYICSENREENHACGGQNDSQGLTEFCDAENIGTHGGDVHERPVESIPVIFNQWIGAVFDEIEHNAAEINGREKNHQVGCKQVCHFTPGHPTDNHGNSVHTPGYGYEAQQDPGGVGEMCGSSMNDVQVGDGYQQKKNVFNQEMPAFVTVIPTDKKIS